MANLPNLSTRNLHLYIVSHIKLTSAMEEHTFVDLGPLDP